MNSSRKTDTAILGRGLGYLRPHLRLLALGALILPAVALSRLVTPYLLKTVIDGPIRQKNLEGIGIIALVYLFVVVLQGILNLSKQYVMQLLGQRVINDLRRDLFQKVSNLSLSYFDKQPIGKIISRLTNDVDSLNEFLSSGLVEMLADLFLLIGITVVMVWLDKDLALYSLILVPFLLGFVFLARKLMRALFSRLSAKNAATLAFAQEALAGMTVIQAFRGEERSRTRYVGLNDDALVEDLKGVWWSSHMSAVVELSSFLSIGLLLFMSAGKEMSFGTLVAFIEYIQLFYRPIEALSGRFTVLQKALASAEKVFQLFDDGDRYIDPKGSEQVPALEQGIVLEDVHFSYVDHTPVLKNFRLTIPKGHTVALVGATGAGKSSVVKLLERFYQPKSGRILWDGQDLQSFDRQSLRRRIGYVPQETFLFADSLAHNISLGQSDVTKAVDAAKAVQAERVADDLPGGFDEIIGEQGRNLSAGERQLVSFARALARDPDLLILDEATANIDGETEVVIQQALETLLKGRTAVVIAHRLSTIRNADAIAVLHKGELREHGTHEELIALEGLYHTLYKLQGQAPKL